MRGKVRPISRPRRVIIDLMRASAPVPFVSLSRTLNVAPLLEARAMAAVPPGWAAIFVKAFSIVAREEPVLRTLFLAWPWPRLYEIPRSVGMVAIARRIDGEDCVMMQKIVAADQLPLAQVDHAVRLAKSAEVEDVPMFRRIMRVAGLPLPLRRLLWGFGLNVGRQRANYFGNFGITSVSAFGRGELHAISPGPFVVTYGAVNPDRTVDVVIRWDHRVTDAALIANTLSRLEQVFNGDIAAELRQSAGLREPKVVRAIAT